MVMDRAFILQTPVIMTMIIIVIAVRSRRSNRDFLRGSSVRIGTIQRRLALPLRKDDMHKSRSVNKLYRTSGVRQAVPSFQPGPAGPLGPTAGRGKFRTFSKFRQIP